MSNSNDFPLVEAPASGRKGVFSISMVLFSFTFFTGTMFAGGKLGTGDYRNPSYGMESTQRANLGETPLERFCANHFYSSSIFFCF